MKRLLLIILPLLLIVGCSGFQFNHVSIGWTFKDSIKKVYILLGMKMGRNNMKELSRMERKMDYILGGIEMDRRNLKELTKMGK